MVTKRQLGIGIISFGVLGILGVIAVDLFGAGQWSGIGPVQWMGISLGIATVVVGSILVRLGDRPA